MNKAGLDLAIENALAQEGILLIPAIATPLV